MGREFVRSMRCTIPPSLLMCLLCLRSMQVARRRCISGYVTSMVSRPSPHLPSSVPLRGPEVGGVPLSMTDAVRRPPARRLQPLCLVLAMCRRLPAVLPGLVMRGRLVRRSPHNCRAPHILCHRWRPRHPLRRICAHPLHARAGSGTRARRSPRCH